MSEEFFGWIDETTETQTTNPNSGVQITKETVNHPSHYNTGKIEVIDAIYDWELDFDLGNAVKYIARAGKKDPNKFVEDLEKAIWYIKHKISLDDGQTKPKGF